MLCKIKSISPKGYLEDLSFRADDPALEEQINRTLCSFQEENPQAEISNVSILYKGGEGSTCYISVTGLAIFFKQS